MGSNAKTDVAAAASATPRVGTRLLLATKTKLPNFNFFFKSTPLRLPRVRVPRRAGGRDQGDRGPDHQDEESRRRARPAFDRQGDGIINSTATTQTSIGSNYFH